MSLKEYQLQSVKSNKETNIKKLLIDLFNIELCLLDSLLEQNKRLYELYLPELFNLINVISYELDFIVKENTIICPVKHPQLILINLINLTSFLMTDIWFENNETIALELLYYYYFQLIYSLGYQLSELI